MPPEFSGELEGGSQKRDEEFSGEEKKLSRRIKFCGTSPKIQARNSRCSVRMRGDAVIEHTLHPVHTYTFVIVCIWVALEAL